eukprot:TCALIF_10308-PA protein Name:"Similar to RAB32 Ras-related protein Rab-32 (Homo sapiens)" AED:0.72 eAED:0.72 QI:0/0/0/0.33/0.5/0.33/3/0/255
MPLITWIQKKILLKHLEQSKADLPIKDPNTSVVELAPREKGDGSSSSLGDHPERAHRDLWHGHPDVETGSTAEITPENDSESLDDAFHTYTELGVDEWMEPIQTVEKIEMDTLATESGPNQYQAQTSEMEVENASTAEALVAEGGSGTDETNRCCTTCFSFPLPIPFFPSLSLFHVRSDYPLVTRECLFKVLLIGDPGVGKTSFVQRYTNNIFRTDYKGTVGVDFALKVLRVNRDMTVKLQLWDVAGKNGKILFP